MNAPLSRRALLGATAALGVAALPAAALAGTSDLPMPEADAALFGLIARHAEAEATWEATCRDLEAARDRAWAAYPSRPDALTATFGDLGYGLVSSGRLSKAKGEFRTYFNLDDLDRLRAAGPVTSLAWDDDGRPLPSVPNPAGEARRREIVETFDRWLADRAAVDDRLGLTAAEGTEEHLRTAMEAAEATVEAYLPTTLAGVRAKAAWALGRCDCADAALAFLRQLAGNAAPPVDAEAADDMQAAA